MEGQEQNQENQQQQYQEEVQPSKAHIEIENNLKQLFFAVIDLNEDQKDKLSSLMGNKNEDDQEEEKKETEEEQKQQQEIQNQNKEEINQLIKTILLTERYYDVVSDFAKSWATVDKQNPKIPENILAGSEIVCEFLQQNIPEVLKGEFNKELTNKIKEDYKINKEITEQEVNFYLDSFKKQKANDRLSDLDKEENWENLSNVSDDDVIYLGKDQQGQFQIDDEEDEGEIYQPPEDDEDDEENKENDSQEDEERIKNRDKEDFSVHKLHQHKSFVTRLTLHPNGKILVSGGGDDVALAWDLEKNDLLEIVSQKKETIDTIGFNFDGSLLATGTLDGQLDIYAFKDNKFTHKVQLEGISEEITFIEWHKKGNAVIAGGFDNTAYMWNGAKGDLIQSFYGHEDVINFGCFSPDGSLILTASADKSVRVWNPKTGQENKKIQGYGFHEDSINTISFSQKNTSLIATGGEDKTACLANITTGKILGRTAEHEGIVDSVIFVQNQDWFITGSGAGEIRIYEIANIKLRNKIKVKGSVTKLIELPKSYNILASTNEGRIYLFDYRNPSQNIKVIKGAGQPIHDIILLENALYAACEDGCIRYHEFNKFEILKEEL